MCKKWDKCTEAFQRSFLLVAQSAFLTTTFLDRAKPTAAWVGASHGGNYGEKLGMPGASQVGRGGFSGSQVCQAGLAPTTSKLWNINLPILMVLSATLPFKITRTYVNFRKGF